MDPVHRALLRTHRLQLSGQLLVSDSIVPFLYQENILTEAQVEDIESQPTNRQKSLKLLDILPSRGPRAFDSFLRSLEEFRWVRDQLLLELQTRPGPSSTERWPAASTTPAGSESLLSKVCLSASNHIRLRRKPNERKEKVSLLFSTILVFISEAGLQPAAVNFAPLNTAEQLVSAVCRPADVCRPPDSVLQKVPSDRELSRLASRLGAEWESVLMDLGLSAEALFRCRSDHSLSTQGAALAGLVRWRRSEGKKATVERLLRSLTAAGVHPAVLEDVLM
ncbi:death domain-containing protein CRADD isoform X1 [Siniperca chuatsi]|uniref:death domain-containing protein CRADD isoform X1 n=1 Tax=Siniperca chuatsi TaxID=119488 RepID=UPI001CE07893|nr:death domain-containing protein CRADD isoform X1 [Siniperca chuatsi]